MKEKLDDIHFKLLLVVINSKSYELNQIQDLVKPIHDELIELVGEKEYTDWRCENEKSKKFQLYSKEPKIYEDVKAGILLASMCISADVHKNVTDIYTAIRFLDFYLKYKNETDNSIR
jgi:hypothetical protein